MTPQAQNARMGPRPLPLHLMAAMTTLGSSPAALTSLIGACSSSNANLLHPNLREKAAALSADLQNVLLQRADEPALLSLFSALDLEIRHRADRFLTGIEAYRRHPYRRSLPQPEIFAAIGSTQVQDFGNVSGDKGQPILLVPSLVNRGYILDLSQDCSLARWLAAEGLHPYLVEWGMPGAAEADYGLDHYIARLTDILQQLTDRHGQPVALLGYCMGGLLTLSAALEVPDCVDRQILMATPWDFHSDGGKQAALLGAMMPWLDPVIAGCDILPTDILQMFFTMLDPLLGLKKFTRFAALDPDSDGALSFVALEDWLNDGVPLTGATARTCLHGWYGENRTARGEWLVHGRPVLPEACHTPTLCLIPSSDRIVPPASAQALAEKLPRGRTILPHAGHIGMVASRRARALVWDEIRDFATG